MNTSRYERYQGAVILASMALLSGSTTAGYLGISGPARISAGGIEQKAQFAGCNGGHRKTRPANHHHRRNYRRHQR